MLVGLDLASRDCDSLTICSASAELAPERRSPMGKWKKAVIHLECATDSEHFYDRIKRIEVLRNELEEGKITHAEFAEQISTKSRDIRYHGTAIFLSHHSKRYLITARHVLWDKHSAEREYQEELDRAQRCPEHMRPSLIELAKERAIDKIFGIVFRVPSLDEVLQGYSNRDRAFLMNLGAGTSFTVPYTFSSPDLDIAVVSLDQRDSRFADELISKGYESITLSDIGGAPSREGAEVYTVGYPSPTALLGQIGQHPAVAHWSSSYFSLPTFSFGRVSMLHDALPFFWVDMSIYPGHSGGPIIENDKLVGIVSGQPTIPVEEDERLRTRIPFGKIVKASHVPEILFTQEKKGQNAA
jgi:hypothetical protein